MTMAIKDLETRIIEKADKELQDRIDKAWKPAEDIFRCAPSGSFDDDSLMRKAEDKSAWFLLTAFKPVLFEAMRDKNREKALAEFLTQVESLQEQIDELRDGVESN